jgi:hypothetical protein
VIDLYTQPRFAPLPDAKHGPPGIRWQPVIDKLANTPGEWAAIGTLPANGSMGNRGVKLRRKGVETRTRSNGDGTCTVWARYIGTDTPTVDPRPRRTTRWSWGRVEATA